MVNEFFKNMYANLCKICNIPEDECIGIFAYGSINYKLNYDNSDLDIVIICKNTNSFNIKTIIGDISVLSINDFINMLKLREIKAYEVVFTKYQYINPPYQDAWNKFKIQFKQCFNSKSLLTSLNEKINECLLHLFYICSNNETYNKKYLYLLIQKMEQYLDIINDLGFEESLVYKNRFNSHDLIKIKSIPNYLTLQEVKTIKDNCSVIESYYRHFGHKYKKFTEKEQKSVEILWKGVCYNGK